MENFTVSTYSEYAAVTAQIYGEYTESETLIVFRGQTAEYRLPDGRLALQAFDIADDLLVFIGAQ